MDIITERQLETAVEIAHSLFERGKVSGSATNISIRIGDFIYISRSGTSFGILEKEQFSTLLLDGTHVEGIKPSKEYPLHAMICRYKPEMKGVVHTHSFYSTLWSCLEHKKKTDVIPAYTPYLRMKTGTVGVIPYAKPGNQELFGYMEEWIVNSDAYLLKRHDPVVAGRMILDTLYGLEELEESAKTAWHLRGEHVQEYWEIIMEQFIKPVNGMRNELRGGR